MGGLHTSGTNSCWPSVVLEYATDTASGGQGLGTSPHPDNQHLLPIPCSDALYLPLCNPVGYSGRCLGSLSAKPHQFPLLAYLVLPRIQLDLSVFLKTLLRSLLAAVVAGLVLFCIQRWLPHSPLTLAVEVFFGTFLYLACGVLFCREVLWFAWSLGVTCFPRQAYCDE